MAKKFKTSVFDHPIIGGSSVEVDLETNRNSRMIKELLRPDVNGLFLYYLEGTGYSTQTAILCPPGLTKDEVYQLQQEFAMLFERYARAANKRRK